MNTDIEKLRKDLLMAAELVNSYPELMPLLERVGHEYDATLAHGTTLARIKAKLDITDD